MRRTALAGIFALTASTALAQTGTAPEPAAEPATNTGTGSAAPENPAPAAAADPNSAAGREAGAAGAANLCQELLAFMQAPPPETAAPAAAAKPATASTEKAAPGQQSTSALAGTTGSGEAASAKPDGKADSAQEVTGQKGVATDAPEPSSEKVAAGSVANAPQKDSLSAPLPPADVTSTPKEAVITVAQAEELATSNDIAACQDTARQMRVAGIAMPPPLIALAALDLQFQQTAAPQAEAPAADDPAAAQQQDAEPETAAPTSQTRTD